MNETPDSMFETGRPVTGSAFFGRMSELHDCQQRLAHQQSVLITGESRIGKTSLLRELERRLAETESQQRVVSTDMGFAGDPDFGMGVLIEELQRKLAPGRTHLRGCASPRMLEHMLQTSPVHIIAFLNDFDSLLRLSPDSDRYAYQLKTLVDAGHTAVCAVAQRSGFIDGQNRLIPYPIVSFFHEVPLRGFTRSEACEFLSVMSERNGDGLTEHECRHIVMLLGSVPHRLQEFGFDLFCNHHFRGSTSGARLAFLTTSIETAFFAFKQRFYHRVADDPVLTDSHWARLLAVAHGEPIGGDPETEYLQKRGFLAAGDEPFAYHGTLFRDYLAAIPNAKEGGTSIRERLVSAGGIAIEAAIKGVIGSVFK